MMTVDETGTQEEAAKPSYRYALVLIPAILYYNGVGLSSYAISEWIQDEVKMKYFPNAMMNKSSPCESVNKSSSEYILHRKMESEAAIWMLYNSLAGSVPSLVASLLLPAYSDSLGRRFLFVVGTVGFLVKCIFTTSAVHFHLSLVYAIVGSAIEGCCGSYYVLQSAIYSYVADVTASRKMRTVTMTAIDGIEKLCMTISGLAAGYFISHTGYFIPLLSTCAMTFVALVLHLSIIPESYPKHLRSTTFTVLGNIRRAVEFYTSDVVRGKRGAYILLIFAYFLSEITSAHRTTIELIYQLGSPFCWGAEKIGIFAGIRHGTQSFAAIFLIKPLRILFSELQIALMSTVFKISSYLLEGLARTDLALFMVPIPATFSNIALSMIKSIMSLMTPPDKQGSLFAGIFAVYGACGIVAPYLMNSVYADTVSLNSGIVFLVLAGIAGMALLLLILFYARCGNKKILEDERSSINTVSK